MSKMHRSVSAAFVDATVDDAVLRKKEQKDVELDKKIIALRKKNEALMRRYHEIEEDRKRAEQEGMAVTSRKARPDGLTITITKAHNEKRVVSEKWGSSGPPASSFGIGSEEEEDDEESDHLFTFRMGKRVQLAVTMDNKAKGKRVVSEKRGSECLVSPGEAPDISEEEIDQLVAFRRGRRMQIAITMDNKGRVDEKRTVERRWSEGDKHSENVLVRKERGKSPQKSPGDKGSTLTGRERSEYMRWKKERDQIDLERLARHKNARGEWRRAWDTEKSEHMFDDTKDGEPALDCVHNKKGGRNARKSQHRTLPSEGKSGGQHRRSTSESAARTLPVVSSKARGKDRLTGRARRWDAKEGEEMPFVKDEPDKQRSSTNEQLKKQALASEAVKEHNFPAGLENNIKPPEHSAPLPQAQRDEWNQSAGEEQGANEKARRCLTQGMSPAIRADETAADLKLSKSVTGTDLSPMGNYMNSSSSQGVPGNVVQTSGCDLQEINSIVYGGGLDKSAYCERNPCGEQAGKGSELLNKEGGSGEGQGLITVGQGEENQVGGLQKEIIPAKERDTAACLVRTEESRPPCKEIPDPTNEYVQEGAQMRNKEEDQPPSCSNKAQD
ncbi:coiled-coil domain-containing protein 9B isoform X1 [Podarcis raffonei]|uniref:coiled-coil domain-containing protein 9B isoform X1 n=1 Tax=Podarcis raffonei TaxID=65483 RepID=UPI002329709C|nr:coiled-coil domain-containing protein 9B isoform X1 [Podarcis raffonei]